MEYAFKAVDKNGRKINGTRETASQVDLARDLRQEGYFLIEAKAKQTFISAQKEFNENFGLKINISLDSLFKRISLEEKMIFARHLALMVRSGFSLNKALETLSRQTRNKHFAIVLKELSSNVSAGKSFYEAVSAHQDVFSPIFINMIKVGEVSGKLEGTLKLAALQLKREHSLKSKIKGALTYPIVVITALIGVAAIMMIFVLPQLVASFAELNAEMPISTQIVFGIVKFFSRFWHIVIVMMLAFIYGMFLFTCRTKIGKRWVNLMFLKLPIFSSLTKKLNSARFSRTLGSLLASGVSLAEAIKITGESLTNVFYREAVFETLGEVEQGKTLSGLLAKRPDLFPPVVTEMLAVGEETGSLAAILRELARFFENEVSVATKGLSSIIEPIIMIVIGIAVGIFAISVIQPIYSISTNIN